jgi:hypothetical protein
MMGNPLLNDASLSQTAGRTKTRQPGLLVKPAQNVLSSYDQFFLFVEPRIGEMSNTANFSRGVIPQHNQFTAGLLRFSEADTKCVEL